MCCPWAPPECGPAAVAAVPAKIATAASASSPRTAQTRLRSTRRLAAVQRRPRAPGERRGADQDHHREREVGHHEARGELVDDGQAAEHGLGEHAERQREREQRQVAAERPAPEREHGHERHGDADDRADDAVAELDQRVGLQRRVGVPVAARPVRAAEPRPGEAHRGAGQHDRRQRAERREREQLELPGRHLDCADAGAHAAQRMPGNASRGQRSGVGERQLRGDLAQRRGRAIAIGDGQLEPAGQAIARSGSS